METILHAYHPKRSLLLLEYNNTTGKVQPNIKASTPPNVLLFVGGLYDNFRWPRYLDDLAALFPRDLPDQNWRLMQVQLSSNGRSWGLFDLDRDVSTRDLVGVSEDLVPGAKSRAFADRRLESDTGRRCSLETTICPWCLLRDRLGEHGYAVYGRLYHRCGSCLSRSSLSCCVGHIQIRQQLTSC